MNSDLAIAASLLRQLPWAACWLARPTTKVSVSSCGNSEDGWQHLLIEGITRAEAVEVQSASRRAEMLQALRQLPARFSALTLVDQGGRAYDLPIERGVYWDAVSMLTNSEPGPSFIQSPIPVEEDCDRILQEIWENPIATCLIEIDTGKLLLGNEPFAQQVGFRNPLEAWGLNVLSTWIPAELTRLLHNLNQIPLGQNLGTQEMPYEYRAISLADVVRLMELGHKEADAIAQARRVELGAACRQVIFGGKYCRVNTTHHFRYA